MMESRDYTAAFAGLHNRSAFTDLIFEEMERAASIGGFLFDFATEKLYWSRGMHRIYETDPATFTPTLEAAERFYSGETFRMLTEKRRQLLELLISEYALDLEITTAKGNRRWVHAVSRADVVEGRTVRIFGTVQDITKRKQAEAALEESLRRFEVLADQAPVLIWMSDRDNNCTYVNRYWQEFTGRSLEDNLGTGWIQSMHPQDIEQSGQTISRTFEARGKISMEYRVLRHDGVYRWILDTAAPRFTADGVFEGYIGTCVDITERKQAEKALREMEEQYRLIYENSIEAILFTNPDGVVYSANPEACRMLGRSEEEIRRLGRDGLIDQNDPRLARALKERKQTGKFKGELNFLHPDGTPFPVELSSTIFHDSAGHERTSMFIQDVTEKKKAEGLLRQSNEQLRLLSDHLNTVRENERTRIAREVHDELGQVFTALKMEMMTLLRSVSGASEEIPPAAYAIMQMIESGIRSVQHISSSLRPRLLDDFGLVAAIEWQAEDFQKRTGIPVALSLPPEELQISREISTAVFRIVQESLTNILRHAQATNTSITLELRDGHLRFAISDNGVGISPGAVTDPSSFGLMGIRERLRMFDGSVEFTLNETGGTSVRAHIPLHDRESHE